MLLNQESLEIQKDFQSLDTVVYVKDIPGGGRFSTLAGSMDVTFYAPGIIRLQIDAHDRPDYGLLTASPQEMDVTVKPIKEGHRLESGNVAFDVLNAPMRIALYKDEQIVLESVTDRAFFGNLRWYPFARSEDAWLVTLALRSGLPIYGLGEKFGPLNRKGQMISSWNEDATNINAELSYKNTPFAWSPNGWGLFVHTTARVQHAVGYPQWSHRSYILKLRDNDLDMFFLTGESPAEIIDKYTNLTGRAPQAPRWSYGVWMSRAFYPTQQETLDVAEKLRERKIPSDVIVLDGRAWHKMETRFDFQWDQDRYPDPAGFMHKLRDMNFRLCLWEYPYISTRNPQFNELAEKDYLLKTSSGHPYIHRWLPYPFDASYPHLLPSGIVDFTNPDAYRWYRDMHKPLFDIGVSVMKVDYGESIPEDTVAFNGDTGQKLHNVYSLLYNKCVYEATEKYSHDKGSLVWGRAGWSGSQRYPMQWGGDPQCDWEGLAASIRGGLSWGMSGAPYYSHDIGGFTVGQPETELYIRWAQVGVMMSHTRFHGAGLREPWAFGEQAEEIVCKWLNWRYRLIPYLQSCALQAEKTGLPIMRAMPLVFPEDQSAWSYDEQYMLGDSLLVIPVINPEQRAHYYLPPGDWYHLSTGEKFTGPLTVKQDIPLEYIPVFGRAGYILPLGPEVQHTDELKPGVDLEEIWVFGDVQHGINLPRLTIRIDADGQIQGVPDGVKIKHW